MAESRINLLDKDTIDQIAAGEVVERPASVVKELVENSIDSGAHIISIEITQGGLKSIRISDDGCGISKEDIPKAFLRHATSKLHNAKELANIITLGFRGEALSSICAVSMVELLTKTKDDLLGYHYVCEGGRELEFSEMGVCEGTTIFVRNLFYNTPARKKFLKTAQTEGSYISDFVERLALSHPEIAFRFISDGRERLHTLGTGRLMDCIYQVYGKDIASNLLELSFDGGFFTASGYIGKPQINRGNRAFQTFFVENRYVRSKLLSGALEEGYHGYIMGHQFPFAVIFLSFDTDMVDVNVHPSKLEVRFEREKEIYEILRSEVAKRLCQREDIASVSIAEKSSHAGPLQEEAIVAEPTREFVIFSQEPSPVITETRGYEPFEKKDLSEVREEVIQSFTPPAPEPKYEQASFLTGAAIKRHKIIGQAFDTYWLVEYEDCLYIIDQHAAHEKVLYEQTMADFKNRVMSSQMLSPGILLTLSDEEVLALKDLYPVLQSIGFEIEHFGQKEYIINAVPDNLFKLDSKDLLYELLDHYTQKGSVDRLEMIVDKVATLSCKAAIKGNNHYSYAEMDALLLKLFALENPYHCPHGRPTMIKFSKTELEKSFMRIVS